ncbi:hypothetical protein CFC21_055618 [Triticum aestivum]|uniref:Uncharacterized protein n=2 Tax=Triticum aestivum TaxID=4565 RepID=A0A3B6I2Z1_WHEAT|nr:uncharacterized protein LOC123083548 [Triticum aestivum]KAF7046596.1 hypothetical protein CFC21_055618 [Triticum aestivum]
MALRTLAARVRTSAAALCLQTPALGLSPPPAGRPNLHSAAATRRLPHPVGGRPCLISSRNLGGSPAEDAARKMVLEYAAILERLEKSHERFKAHVGLMEKFGKVLKWSLACIIPVPLVYTIAEYY